MARHAAVTKDSPLAAKARKLIAETLLCDPELVTDDALLVDRLEADEMEIVELSVAIEAEFAIDVEDDTAADWKTVDDVIRYIESKSP